MVSQSSPSVSPRECAKCTGPGGNRCFWRCQDAIRRSWREFHWSASGKRSSSQNHCGPAASIREVGVSALYSKSLAGPVPS